GLLVELKGTDLYFEKGFGMEEKVMEALKEGGIDRAQFHETIAPRVVVQTFDRVSLGRLAEITDDYPLVLLIGIVGRKNGQVIVDWMSWRPSPPASGPTAESFILTRRWWIGLTSEASA